MLVSLLASLMPLMGQALAAALLAAGTWAATRLADWLRLSADSQVRGYLLAIIEVAVDAAAVTLNRAPEGDRAAVLRDAHDYVQERAPDALRRFRIGAAALEEMIDQRLHGRGL